MSLDFQDIVDKLRELQEQLINEHKREVHDLGLRLQDALRESQHLNDLLDSDDSSRKNIKPHHEAIQTSCQSDQYCPETLWTQSSVTPEGDGCPGNENGMMVLTAQREPEGDTPDGDAKPRHSNPMQLRVTILSASNLRNADFGLGQGTSDPYCVFQVVGKPASMAKTSVDYNTQFPVWNHELFVSNFTEHDKLEFTVYDEDFGKQDDFLGRAVLDADQFLSTGFDGSLTLEDAGKLKAYIRVQVTVIHDNDGTFLKKIAQSKLQWPLPEGPQSEDSFAALRSRFSRITTLHSTAYGEVVGDPHVSCMQRFVILPDSKFRLVWDMTGVCCIACDVFMIPFVEAFRVAVTKGVFGISIPMASYWSCDIALNFFTGFFDYGVCELRIKKIARRYLQSWFLLDTALVFMDWLYIVGLYLSLFSSNPNPDGGQYDTGIVKVMRSMRTIRYLRLARMLSLLRLIKVQVLLSFILASLRSPAACAGMKISEATIFILIVNHLVSCAWYAIGYSEYERGTPSWVGAEDIEHTEVSYKYATALHWAITQFTPASMNVQPCNLNERLFTIFIDFCGLVIFSTFVSTITSNMTQVRLLSRETREREISLKQFCREKKVSLELASRMMRSLYPKLQINKCTHFENVHGIKSLSSELVLALKVEVLGSTIQNHPFFLRVRSLSGLFFQQVCNVAAKEMAFVANHEIFREGQTAEAVYFLISGACTYIRAQGSIKVMDECISEAAIWVQGWAHRGSLVADEPTEAILLKLDVLHKLLGRTIARRRISFHRGSSTNSVAHTSSGSSHPETALQLSRLEETDESLRYFIRAYAAAILREPCPYTTRAMRFTDLWCKRQHSQEIVQRICFGKGILGKQDDDSEESYLSL